MICIANGGIPYYAAGAIRQFAASCSESVRVVATASDVPKTVDGSLEIAWVTDDDARTLREVLGEVPRILVVSGWFIPSFNRFVDEVRANGGRVIVCSDNRCTGSWRDLLRAAKFRLTLRRKFDAMMVPGKSGLKLARLYGMGDRVAGGLYTADPTVFCGGRPLAEREKVMLYVGRFDVRKNIVPFMQAFVGANGAGDWRLVCVGQGAAEREMRQITAGRNDIEIRPFAQPSELAEYYRLARVFVLPSLEDHWGVVVHEAALSGCALLLSKNVGAAEDLLGVDNGVVFVPENGTMMQRAISRIMNWGEAAWVGAETESRRMAAKYSPERYAENLMQLVGDLEVPHD